jgi:tRNA-dihydrouridine synthase A
MKFYVAPMLDYTNKHYRTLLRHVTRKSTLFTEMVVCNTIIHGGGLALEADFEFEQPLILQLGGSDPKQMELASRIAKSRGYANFNINVGCPSAKVSGTKSSSCITIIFCMLTSFNYRCWGFWCSIDEKS